MRVLAEPTKTYRQCDVRRAATAFVLSLLISLAGKPSRAADVPLAASPARPRIALVLSGGGARGIAHVGVLRALERMHVPVDFVTGTSMGAVVGGLYAAGYSPDELETIVRTIDWHELIQDAPDRRHLPYRRKVDDLNYLTRWELGVSTHGVTIPPGLVSGHRLGVVLRLLALRAAGIDDFDQLPLPFRAVATDVATGEAVVLDRGDLATAIRASMAVPGLFSPVDLDGRRLVDGGTVANLPVAAARAMKPDVVLAVDVGKPLEKTRKPESMTAILSRTVDFLTRREVERAIADVNVLVQPDLSDIEFFAFDQVDALVARGDAGAGQAAADLQKLAVDDAEWAAYLQRQRTTPKISLRSVTVDPGLGLPPQAARRAVRTRPGELDPQLLAEDLGRMWELGEFEAVDFALVRESAESWALTITGRRKSWGPNYARFGLGLVSDLEGMSRFNVLGAITMTQLNRRGGELKVTAQLGGDPALSAELYQPLTPSRIPFAAIGFASLNSKQQIPVGQSLVQYRFWQQRATFDLGASLGRYGEVRAGVRHDMTSGDPSYRATGATRIHAIDAGLHGGFVLDQLDRVNFPRRGFLAAAEVYEARTSLGSDEDYRRLDTQIIVAATRRRNTLLGFLHFTSGLGRTLPPGEEIRLGGLLNLSGLPPGEVSGSYGGVASAVYLYRLGLMPYFGDGVYAGASIETGNAWPTANAVDMSSLRHSYALMFGIDTFLGPLYLAHGVTTGKKDSFYLYLGRSF